MTHAQSSFQKFNKLFARIRIYPHAVLKVIKIMLCDYSSDFISGVSMPLTDVKDDKPPFTIPVLWFF